MGRCEQGVPTGSGDWIRGSIGKKTNLDSMLKSRDITWLTKLCKVKAMVFPVVMYECESWTIKKAECRRIDVFELWCWRRLLRASWTARRSNQSILEEIFIGRTEAEAEASILWTPDGKSWLTGKYPEDGKDWGQEEKEVSEDERVGSHHQLTDMSFSKLREIMKNREAWRAAIHEVTKSWTQLSDWTTWTIVILEQWFST